MIEEREDGYVGKCAMEARKRATVSHAMSARETTIRPEPSLADGIPGPGAELSWGELGSGRLPASAAVSGTAVITPLCALHGITGIPNLA